MNEDLFSFLEELRKDALDNDGIVSFNLKDEDPDEIRKLVHDCGVLEDNHYIRVLIRYHPSFPILELLVL